MKIELEVYNNGKNAMKLVFISIKCVLYYGIVKLLCLLIHYQLLRIQVKVMLEKKEKSNMKVFMSLEEKTLMVFALMK
jgi:hypothetical protein